MWTPFYGQIILDDSIICLKLNEINYFILQDTKEHYFEEEDSLINISLNICQQQVFNNLNIIKDNNSIINSQGDFIKTQDKFVASITKQLIKLEKKNKIKTKVIIIETFIIIGIILIDILL